MGERKTKRITMKLKNPNPLFEQWIIEWRDQAKQKNSKMEFCFNKALTSLRKHALPLESGQDCKMLIGFGDKICRMLDNKLEWYRRHNKNDLLDNQFRDTVMPETKNRCIVDINGKTNRKASALIANVNCDPYLDSGDDEEEQVVNKKTKRSSVKQGSATKYIPQKGSGGYAILITLYEKGLNPNYPGYLTKLELVTDGQFLAKNSFTKPDPGSRYTAWSSMSTLLSKNLVEKKSNPAKFSLTNDGYLLAKKLYEEEENNICKDTFTYNVDQGAAENLCSGHTILDLPNISPEEKLVLDCQSSSSCTGSLSKLSANNINKFPLDPLPTHKTAKTLKKYASSSSIASLTATQEECVIFAPDSFDIILYVDTQETSGSQKVIQDTPILAELANLLVKHEVKHLKVGDYTWICRNRTTKMELVLPYIVERKRLDDFAHSIKDGRYYEQKFRLKKSGVQNITYLIEKYGKDNVGLPLATLYQAATNTTIQDGFCIKFTENCRDTAKYLANFTFLLIRMFESKTIASCPKENLTEISLDDDLVSLMTFNQFNQSSSKNKPLKVTDLFVKMLIQIRGLSVEKALAIVQEYPTPQSLRTAYENNPGTKGEKLLANIKCGDSKKAIGAFLSKTVYQLFTMESF